MSAFRATCSEVIGLTHRSLPFCTVLQAYHKLLQPSVSQQVTLIISYPLAAGVLVLADPCFPPPRFGHSTPHKPLVSPSQPHIPTQLSEDPARSSYKLRCLKQKANPLSTLHHPKQATSKPTSQHKLQMWFQQKCPISRVNHLLLRFSIEVDW